MSEPILSANKVRNLSPLKQFVIINGIGLLFMVSCRFWSNDPEIHWIISSTGIAFYLWLNTLILFFVKKKLTRYTLLSILFFILTVVLFNFAAEYFSPLSLLDLYVYQTLNVVTCIFYFVSLGVTFIGKGISSALGMDARNQ